VRRRRPPLRPAGRTIPALCVAFALGGVAGWWSHKSISSRPADATLPEPAPTTIAPLPSLPVPEAVAPDSSTVAMPRAGDLHPDAIAELRRRTLRLPLDDANVSMMKDGFAAPRTGEPRGHEAVDLLAPRNTPVRAVEDGTIAKLYFSKAGGRTVYQFDPTGRFCYYYAHLDRYADGLRDGQRVARGEVIGYVGTTGNAPPNMPHLHFAIFKLGDDKRWWQGTAIDPYLVFGP